MPKQRSYSKDYEICAASSERRYSGCRKSNRSGKTPVTTRDDSPFKHVSNRIMLSDAKLETDFSQLDKVTFTVAAPSGDFSYRHRCRIFFTCDYISSSQP
jgi:hypothetical protein